jgi:D-beta-D-heptose 7-phosphate kinase/D-beta-D-heptose 1-phosphate adenosyltransferase
MLKSCAAIVISDYAKGLISPELLKEILPMARASGKIVCVDPKLKNLGLYGPATVVTPNTLEAERAAGRDVVLDIDVQGAKQVAERVDGAVLIFVLPPSWAKIEY